MTFFSYFLVGGIMRLSDLQSKDIVSIIDGKKVGKIIDVIFDNTGLMKSLVIQKSKFFFSGTGEVEIKWNQIEKIGEDVILIKV